MLQKSLTLLFCFHVQPIHGLDVFLKFNVRPLEPRYWLEALTFGLLIGALASHGCWVGNFIKLTNSQSSVHFSVLWSFASFKCSTEVMSVLQRDGMHAWGQIGNTAGKPFLVFTAKRVSSLQDGFVFTVTFDHFLGKLGFRVKFSLQAQSPCGLGGTQCRHQCRSPESQTFGTSSCWGGPGAVGHHGVDVRPKDTMRNEPGMVSWCPAVQQREGGMPKAADMPSVRNQTTEHALQEL